MSALCFRSAREPGQSGSRLPPRSPAAQSGSGVPPLFPATQTAGRRFPSLRLAAFWAGSLLLANAARAGTPATASTAGSGLIGAPAHNWVLPLFTPEGFRSILLRGDEARVLREDDRVDVQDINVTLFAGDATNRWTTIILSPEASYYPHDALVSGPSLVRVLRNGDDSELSGSNWTYRFARHRGGARETLIIRHDARIVLQSQIHDFLQ